jgi:hypothetical protein|tara:strand:+ start:934 stop:1536 length:603 start_codon:yes stop_codon:yes gene_type:complete
MVRPKEIKDAKMTTVFLESSHLKAMDKSGMKKGQYIRDLLDERFSDLETFKELQKFRKENKELKRDNEILKEINERLKIKITPEVLLSEQIQEKAEELLKKYNKAELQRVEELKAHHEKLIKDYKPLKPKDAEYKRKFKELVAKRVEYGCELKEAKQLTREQIKRDNILNLPTMPELKPRKEILQNFMEEAKRLVMEEKE